jgi:hypothetical protein
MEYAARTMSRTDAAIAVMAIFTGIRNTTRPQKKRSRDPWSRRGMISTTVCI